MMPVIGMGMTMSTSASKIRYSNIFVCVFTVVFTSDGKDGVHLILSLDCFPQNLFTITAIYIAPLC